MALRHVSNEFRNTDPAVRIAAARAVCVVAEDSTLKKVPLKFLGCRLGDCQEITRRLLGDF